jgi:hypothetical protein
MKGRDQVCYFTVYLPYDDQDTAELDLSMVLPGQKKARQYVFEEVKLK